MKNIFILLLSLLVLVGNSQNLTLGEVTELRKKDANEVINTLKVKGWEYDSFKRGERVEQAHSTNFLYIKRQKVDPEYLVVSEFTHYFFRSGESRVKITTFDSTKYNQYLNQIINVYKCKELEPRFVDAGLVSKPARIFQGATTTFIVTLEDSSSRNKSDWTYSFFLASNKDYNENMN